MLKKILTSLLQFILQSFKKAPKLSEESIMREYGYDLIIPYSDDNIERAALGIRLKDETVTLIEHDTGRNYYRGWLTDYEIDQRALEKAEELIKANKKKEEAQPEVIKIRAEEKEKKVEFQMN